MKYILIENYGGVDTDATEFSTRDEAIKEAADTWNRLCDADRKRCKEFYVLESVNPDEDAEDHFDGNEIANYLAAWKELQIAVNYMDDNLREEIHADLAPCEDAEFLEEYKRRHLKKYGEEFCCD